MQEQRTGIKFLYLEKRHNGVNYSQGGLVVDPLDWNPHGLCQPGGLYFTTTEHAHHWINAEHWWVADVVVPDGQPVYADGSFLTTKWKAPQLQLTRVRTIGEWLMSLTDAELRNFMYNVPTLILQMFLRDSALVMRWVKMCPQSIALLDPIRDRDVWRTLVKEDPGNLKYIPECYHVWVV
jgi:hypothetical protein